MLRNGGQDARDTPRVVLFVTCIVDAMRPSICAPGPMPCGRIGLLVGDPAQ